MPLYFFDVKDGKNEIDNEGTTLPDLSAARHEAGRVALDYVSALLQETRKPPGNGGAVVVCVRDEAGAVRATAQIVLSVRDTA